MSAYLMSQYDTTLIAVYAESAGLVRSARAAAVSLRSANNAALACRYGDAAAPLRAVDASLDNARAALAQGITTGGRARPDLTRSHLRALASEFAYQCAEGSTLETHKGGRLIRAIVASLTD